MDIYRILEKLAAVSSKQTLAEGQMKRSLEARAEQMSKAAFVANAGEYGMSDEEAAEFWAAVNGSDDEELDEERRSEEDWDAQALAQQKAKLAREKNKMDMQRRLQNPEKYAKDNIDEAEAAGQFKSGDRVMYLNTFATIVAQDGDAYGIRIDGKPGTIMVPVSQIKKPSYDEGVAEAMGSKPDFLDLDRDGNKKEPMKSAARDKNDAKGSFQKQMGGSARELTKGLSGKPKTNNDMEESALQAYLGKKKYGSEGMKALQQAGREGASREKMAQIRASHDKMDEADMEEGNKFAYNVLKAKAAGKKQADLDGDGDMEKVQEVFPGTTEYELRFGKDDAASAFDKKKISTGTVYSRRYRDEPDTDDDAPKSAGRPKGTGRKLGAKGPSVASKLLKDKGGLKEHDMEEARNPDLQKLRQHHLSAVLGDRAEKARAQAKAKGYDTRSTRAALDATDAFGVAASGKDPSKYGFNVSKEKQAIGMKEDNIDIQDRGEYDREGDMALNQVHQIADAARELHAILASDDNLPEWVQSKITKALDYIDTARDYLDAKDDQEHKEIPEIAPIIAPVAGALGRAAVAGAASGAVQSAMGDDTVEEKAPPGAKAERMVKHIKKGYAKDGGLTDQEKAIAYATAWKAKKAGKVEEESADKKDVPFDGPYRTKDDDKDQFGNKVKHAAQHAARKGLADMTTAALKAELKRRSQVEEESTDTKDKHAEKAGKKVTKDIEHDEGHKGRDDAKAEKAGKKVAKDIEYDDKKDKEEKVDETTVSGSVATAPAGAAPKSKGGMQFGKGVYEGQVAESFETKLKNVLNEGMSVNVSTDDTGKKSISVNATDADADALGDMLKMAGLFSSEGYSRACTDCGGIHEADACRADQVEEDLANSPDEVYADADYMTQTLSGGLNGPKTTGQTTGPVVNRQDNRQGVMAEADRVAEQAESRLWNLYKKI